MGETPRTEPVFCEASGTGEWSERFSKGERSRTRAVCDVCGRRVRVSDDGTSMDHCRPARRTKPKETPR